MQTMLFTVPENPSLSIKGQSLRYPIHRIFCIGRNYAAHAAELNNKVPERPFYFMKDRSSVVINHSEINMPCATNDLHHEVELVVALGKGGHCIKREEALEHVLGVTIGLDLTRRDLQQVVKQQAHPWEIAKNFENSAVIGEIEPMSSQTLNDLLENARIALQVNGEQRQQGHLRDMIVDVAGIIADLSTYYHLLPGDMIFTGTPAGVSALKSGDRVCAEIGHLSPLYLNIR